MTDTDRAKPLSNDERAERQPSYDDPWYEAAERIADKAESCGPSQLAYNIAALVSEHVGRLLDERDALAARVAALRLDAALPTGNEPHGFSGDQRLAAALSISMLHSAKVLPDISNTAFDDAVVFIAQLISNWYERGKLAPREPGHAEESR